MNFAFTQVDPDLLPILDKQRRREPIWKHSADGWRIHYHQGTIISAEEDDNFSS